MSEKKRTIILILLLAIGLLTLWYVRHQYAVNFLEAL